MIPHKDSPLRSYEALHKALDAKGGRITIAPYTVITNLLEHGQSKRPDGKAELIWRSQKTGRVLIGTFDREGFEIPGMNHVPFAFRDQSLLRINIVLNQFGYYLARATAGGPHRKGMWLMYETRSPHLGLEADYRALQPKNHGGMWTYKIGWDGKPIHFKVLSEEEIAKRVRRAENIGAASRRKAELVSALGFTNVAKMYGYKLPKGLTMERAKAMVQYATRVGYRHVAEAHVNGVYIPSDEHELEMAQSGLGELMGQIKRPLAQYKHDDNIRFRHYGFDYANINAHW